MPSCLTKAVPCPAYTRPTLPLPLQLASAYEALLEETVLQTNRLKRRSVQQGRPLVYVTVAGASRRDKGSLCLLPRAPETSQTRTRALVGEYPSV